MFLLQGNWFLQPFVCWNIVGPLTLFVIRQPAHHVIFLVWSFTLSILFEEVTIGSFSLFGTGEVILIKKRAFVCIVSQRRIFRNPFCRAMLQVVYFVLIIDELWVLRTHITALMSCFLCQDILKVRQSICSLGQADMWDFSWFDLLVLQLFFFMFASISQACRLGFIWLGSFWGCIISVFWVHLLNAKNSCLLLIKEYLFIKFIRFN